MLMRLLPFLTRACSGDIGVDLGTDTAVLCALGGELVIAEPSVIAVDAHTGVALAAGSEALELLGRRDVAAIRPIKDGAILDIQRTAELLRHLIAKVERYRRSRPRLVASVPSGMSALHRHAMAEACLVAGAREARLIARPIAAALGCGLPVHEPIGSMVIDLGASISEVAMISMRSIVAAQPIRLGGQDFDRRVVAHLGRTHQLRVGIGGRDLVSGTLTSDRLTSDEICDLLKPSITRIVDATMDTLARTPPQLAADVIDGGITLIGENSLLPVVAQRISLVTGTPAYVADSARTCTAIGAAKSVEQQPARIQPLARTAVPITAATSH